MLTLAATLSLAEQSEDGLKRLGIQVRDGEPGTFTKVVNVVADVCSLIFFVKNGFIAYEVALPMMVCNMTGSYIGSRMALLRGNGFIRILFLVVVFGLILRFGYDIWKMY